MSERIKEMGMKLKQKDISIRNLNKNIRELRNELHIQKSETEAVKRVLIAEKNKSIGKAITDSLEFEDAVLDIVKAHLDTLPIMYDKERC